MTNSAPLLIELLVEELPPKSLKKLEESFANSIFTKLQQEGFLENTSNFQSFATPRRLAVLIHGVLSSSPEKQLREKLIPVSIGLDSQGNPTPPLVKKLTNLGLVDVDPKTLEREGEGKSETLFINIQKAGVSLSIGLQDALNHALQKLPIAKVMRYQIDPGTAKEIDVQFVRPAHGLIALHGKEILPVHLLGLHASNRTLGHRFLSSQPIIIKDAVQYESQLITEGRVLPNSSKRLESIKDQLISAAKGKSVLMPDSLLEEVNALVEWPKVYLCEFEKEFLEVPQECLILTMQTNQKYFAMTGTDGKLSHQFLIVSNIETQTPDAIVSGNERVIRPRLADARFFFVQDKKKSLADRVPELSKVVYHNKLGNQLERIERVQKIASTISHRWSQIIQDTPESSKAFEVLAYRGALLMKTDLLTDMVGEFPELQGIMGSYYASTDGEDPEIIASCKEHYLPRFAGDHLPLTRTGHTLALADKLETIVGIWGIGLSPTGEKDPFALRRHALGICRLIIEKQLALNIPELLTEVKNIFTSSEVQSNATILDITNFILDRLRSYLKEFQGYEFSVEEIESVLSNFDGYIHEMPQKLLAVRNFSQLPEAGPLASANKRIGNILKKNVLPKNVTIDPELFIESAETQLFDAIQQIHPRIQDCLKSQNFTGGLQALSQISEPVANFFEHVMVMDPDEKLKNNRIALLQDLYAQMNRVADLSQLAK